MGGMINSLGDALGFGKDPGSAQMGTSGLGGMQNYLNSPEFNTLTHPGASSQYVNDINSSNSVLNEGADRMKDQYGTGQDMLGQSRGLYGQQGDILSKLQNQGFQLTPEDQTMYGQSSGDIARLFGGQENKTAQNLASRGLSSSGAAGAAFSGLAGNQNEQLANAQQNIMQQRFQNTMNQIGQQQQFMSSLNGQNNQLQGSLGNQASGIASRGSQNINDTYARMMQGLAAKTGGYGSLFNMEQGKAASDSSILQANQAMKPKNFMDYAATGAGQGLQAMAGGGLAGMTGSGGGGTSGGGSYSYGRSSGGGGPLAP